MTSFKRSAKKMKYALNTLDKYHIVIEILNVDEIRKGMVRESFSYSEIERDKCNLIIRS